MTVSNTLINIFSIAIALCTVACEKKESKSQQHTSENLLEEPTKSQNTQIETANENLFQQENSHEVTFKKTTDTLNLPTPQQVETLKLLLQSTDLDVNSNTVKQALEESSLASLFVYQFYKEFILYLQNPEKGEQRAQTYLNFLSKAVLDKGLGMMDLDQSPDAEKPLNLFLQYIGHISFYIIANNKQLFPYTIPPWVVKMYPKVTAHRLGRNHAELSYTGFVKSPSFQILNTFLNEAIQPGELPSYATNFFGTHQFDLDASRETAKGMLNFYPMGLIDKDDPTTIVSETKKNILIWASLGVYNAQLYNQFNLHFQGILKDYQKHTLEIHGDLDEKILKAAFYNYIAYYFITHEPIASVFLYKQSDFTKANIEKALHLQQKALGEVHSDSKTFYNEILCRAITLGVDLEIIEWLIDTKKADINYAFFDETPLMRACDKPNILKFLLQKKTKVDQTNTFGKTALFYAIQYGNLDTVKLIVEAGANVNAKIYSLDKLKKLAFDFSSKKPGPIVLLEQVADFTPSIYAKRYATIDVQNYLQKKNANDGKIDAERVKKWLSFKDGHTIHNAPAEPGTTP